MPPALLTISPVQVMDLWEELMSCLYADNKFGGDVAEIYLYRLASFSPAAVQIDDAKRDTYLHANRALVELCALFATRQEAVVELADGQPLAVLLGSDPNMHRVHIRVRREGGPIGR